MERIYEEFCLANTSLLDIISSQQTAETADQMLNITGVLSKLEGFKTRCKNLHWSAPNNDIHTRLDEFLSEIDSFEYKLAEGAMGILGKIGPNSVNGDICDVNNAFDLTDCVGTTICLFYQSIPNTPCWKGVASECESFIQEVNRFSYLFSLSGCK